MIQPGQIDPAMLYVLKGATLKALLERGVAVNKDHLTLKKDGEKEVISFANEERIFFIANGFPAAGWVPLRRTAPPAPA